MRNLANRNVGAADFMRPGHIFPLVAREGGVLMRSGHTEAAVDLCKLAGLPPIGVICELVNDDGTVKRGPQVAAFADRAWAEAGLGRRPHRLPPAPGDADRARRLLRHRHARRQGARPITYTLPWDPMQHLAVVFGDIRDGEDVPVRLHSEDVVSRRLRHRPPARRDHEDDGRASGAASSSTCARARSASPTKAAATGRRRDGEGHEEARRRESEWREIGLGAQILKDLGISSINLIASRERHYVGLEGFRHQDRQDGDSLNRGATGVGPI